MSHRARQGGFTLLEVIIAIAIMVIAFTAILTVESNSIEASIRAKQLGIVAMLSKSKMAELEYSFEGKAFNEVKPEESGAFAAPYEAYKWKSEIKEVEFPTLNFSTPAGDEGNAAKNASNDPNAGIAERITKLVTKFFNDSLREVVLTVSYPRGKGVQTATITTYWVDLNHAFSLND